MYSVLLSKIEYVFSLIKNRLKEIVNENINYINDILLKYICQYVFCESCVFSMKMIKSWQNIRRHTDDITGWSVHEDFSICGYNGRKKNCGVPEWYRSGQLCQRGNWIWWQTFGGASASSSAYRTDGWGWHHSISEWERDWSGDRCDAPICWSCNRKH